MGGDVDNLALLLKSISARDRHGRDITLYGLRRALVEILASFPIYRTYIARGIIHERDFEYIETTGEFVTKDDKKLKISEWIETTGKERLWFKGSRGGEGDPGGAGGNKVKSDEKIKSNIDITKAFFNRKKT